MALNNPFPINTALDIKGNVEIGKTLVVAGATTLGATEVTTLTASGNVTMSGVTTLSGNAVHIGNGDPASNVEIRSHVITVNETDPTAIMDVHGRLIANNSIMFKPTAIPFASTITLNLATANIFNVATLTGNITLANPTTPDAALAGSWYVYIKQDATGGRTVTLGDKFKDLGGDINLDPNGVTILQIVASGDGFYDIQKTKRL